MAEITKITTPMMPKENIGNRFKPDTDQAFDLTSLSKIHKSENEGKLLEQRPDRQALRENLGRAAIASILKDAGELSSVIKRLALLIETGISVSEAMDEQEIRTLLGSIFVSPEDLAAMMKEQDRSSVLFKGEVFDILRDLLARFPDNPKIREAVANLLKAFDCNVNTPGAIRSILVNCENILDYLYTQDKAQFSSYLDGLAAAILPKGQHIPPHHAMHPQDPGAPSRQGQNAQGQNAPPQDAQTQNTQTQNTQGQNNQTQNAPAQNTQGQDVSGQGSSPQGVPAQNSQPQNTQPHPTLTQSLPETPQAGQQAAQQPGGGAAASQQQPGIQDAHPPVSRAPQQQPAGTSAHQNTQTAPLPETHDTRPSGATAQPNEQPLTQKEVAQLLKSNLLPLLGEIVVKYNQNQNIRNNVMVAVHNTVRVDHGTPESLRYAVNRLVRELRQVANLPEDFSYNLTSSVFQSSRDVQANGNQIMERLVDIINQTLRSAESSPATLRQAETLLMGVLQNESPIMDIIHYLIPIQTPTDQMIAELYIDPDSGSQADKEKGKQSRKLFMSFESAAHGSFELSFLQTGEHVDFAMWCPGALVKGLSSMKRVISNIMQMHGFTLSSYSVDEFRSPHSVAEVFPRLLNRRVGIDIRV